MSGYNRSFLKKRNVHKVGSKTDNLSPLRPSPDSPAKPRLTRRNAKELPMGSSFALIQQLYN